MARVKEKEAFLEKVVRGEIAILRGADDTGKRVQDAVLGSIDIDYIEKWGKVEKPKLGDLTWHNRRLALLIRSNPTEEQRVRIKNEEANLVALMANNHEEDT